MKKLIHEIHRRSLWQVLGIYLAVSWIVLQVVDVIGNNFGLPEWVPPAALILLLVGLPIVIGTAFIQEGVTTRKPESQREPAAGPGEVEAAPASRAGAHHRVFTWRNALLGGGAAFAFLGLLTAGYLFMRTAGIGPAGTLVARGVIEEGARVVLADFDSGEEDLGDLVTEAIRVDLSQAAVVSLVDRSVLTQSLALMERPPGTRFTSDLAREVAVREGATAVVSGEVSSAGGTYLLTARLTEAESGAELLSVRETASELDEVISAVDRLSGKLRERLGEPLRSVARRPPLERVTTPSLEALRFYSQAWAADTEGQYERSIRLLEQAVAEDPDFGMALRKLATLRRNEGRPRSEWAPPLERAFELRDRLTPEERHHVVSQYHAMLSGDVDRQIEALESLLELRPDDLTAMNNLAVAYSGAGDLDRADEWIRRKYETGSRSPLTHFILTTSAINLGRLPDAEGWVDSMEVTHPEQPNLLAVRLTQARGDYEGALAALDVAEERFGRPIARDVAADRATVFAITGRLAEANRIDREEMSAADISGDIIDYWNTAASIAERLLRVRQDSDGATAVIEAALAAHPIEEALPEDRPYLRLAGLAASSGRVDRARAWLEEFESAVDSLQFTGSSRRRDRVEGEIALAEGRFDEAIAAFSRAERGPCTGRCPDLARAYDAAGRRDSAAVLYARYLSTPRAFANFGDQYFKGPFLERLGQLYDEEGDLDGAATYYAQFVELWAEADPELQPRVRAAQARLEEIARQRG